MTKEQARTRRVSALTWQLVDAGWPMPKARAEAEEKYERETREFDRYMEQQRVPHA